MFALKWKVHLNLNLHVERNLYYTNTNQLTHYFGQEPVMDFFPQSAYETKFLIILFERAFKMMKSGVYFTVIALLVAELFKILIYAN